MPLYALSMKRICIIPKESKAKSTKIKTLIIVLISFLKRNFVRTHVYIESKNVFFFSASSKVVDVLTFRYLLYGQWVEFFLHGLLSFKLCLFVHKTLPSFSLNSSVWWNPWWMSGRSKLHNLENTEQREAHRVYVDFLWSRIHLQCCGKVLHWCGTNFWISGSLIRSIRLFVH